MQDLNHRDDCIQLPRRNFPAATSPLQIACWVTQLSMALNFSKHKFIEEHWLVGYGQTSEYVCSSQNNSAVFNPVARSVDATNKPIKEDRLAKPGSLQVECVLS